MGRTWERTLFLTVLFSCFDARQLSSLWTQPCTKKDVSRCDRHQYCDYIQRMCVPCKRLCDSKPEAICQRYCPKYFPWPEASNTEETETPSSTAVVEKSDETADGKNDSVESTWTVWKILLAVMVPVMIIGSICACIICMKKQHWSGNTICPTCMKRKQTSAEDSSENGARHQHAEDMMSVSAKLASVEQKLEEKTRELQAAGRGSVDPGVVREEISRLREARDKMSRQREQLDRKLHDGTVLSTQERRLIEIEEGLEALDAAIEYKTESINSQQDQIRQSLRSGHDSTDHVLASHLSGCSPHELRTLLARYFERFIDLRELARQKDHLNSELKARAPTCCSLREMRQQPGVPGQRPPRATKVVAAAAATPPPPSVAAGGRTGTAWPRCGTVPPPRRPPWCASHGESSDGCRMMKSC